MPKLTTLKSSTPQHVMVFGPSFSGKTELVGKLAEHYKLLWFDLEQGRTVLFKLPPAQQENITLIQLPDSSSYPIAAETIPKVLKTAETGNSVDICMKHGKVGCMLCKRDPEAVFDTVNLSEVGLDTIVVFDSGTQFTNSIISHITKNEAEDYKLTWDDWGSVRFLIDKNMSRVQVAPYHTVWISHEEEVEMVDGKKKIVPIMGSSKSSRNVARYFDHVVYVEVKNKQHTQSSATTYMNNILTGSRLDAKLESGDTLLDIFKGEIKQHTNTPVKTKSANSILSKIGK